MFLRLISIDLKLQARRKTSWFSLIFFFIAMIVLMPFALGDDAVLLARIAPGILWLCVLLLTLLSLDQLFASDARDGGMDIMLTSRYPLPLLIISRLGAQILLIWGALAVMMIPATIMLGLDFALLPVMAMTFMLGVPILILFGGVMAGLTIALPKAPALLFLLLLPFYMPVLIFATGAVGLVQIGLSPAQPLLFLGAILSLALPSLPFIIARILRRRES